MTFGLTDSGVTITWALNLKPEIAEAMGEAFARELPNTRAFPGCRNVAAFRSHEAANRIILIEQWDSREAYQAYLDWRQEQGLLEVMRQSLESVTQAEFWSALA